MALRKSMKKALEEMRLILGEYGADCNVKFREHRVNEGYYCAGYHDAVERCIAILEEAFE